MLDKFKVEKVEAKEYPPLPEDVFQVELLDMTSEMKPKYKAEGEEMKLSFQFTILSGKDIDGQDLRGRNIWRNFVPAYLYEGKNGKNVLYQIVEAMIGHHLTREEEAAMDSDFLEALIGKQCRVVIKNRKKDDKVYSNIENFLIANDKFNSLTEEEKENARVKDKEHKESQKTSENISDGDYDEEAINVNDIPF